MTADVVLRGIISNVFACSTYTEITINGIVLHIIQKWIMPSAYQFGFI